MSMESLRREVTHALEEYFKAERSGLPLESLKDFLWYCMSVCSEMERLGGGDMVSSISERILFLNTVSLIFGDITTFEVDAIVNAANPRMLGGGGVDGAIHQAAGTQLREACAKHPLVEPGVRCPTGEVRITPAFDLKAKAVIHAVGPIYKHQTAISTTTSSSLPPDENPREKLALVYKNIFSVSKEKGYKTLALPAISCGVYGYPPEEAAEVLFEVLKDWWKEFEGIHLVIFYGQTELYQAYSRGKLAAASISE